MHSSGGSRRVSTLLAGLTVFALTACTPAAPAVPTTAPTTVPEAKPTATSAPAQAQPTAAAASSAHWPTTPDGIYTYTGADRQQMLETGARQEGRFVWYTALIVDGRSRPLAEAFQKKYPFVQFDIVFMDGLQIAAKAVEERQSGVNNVDIFECSYPGLIQMKEAQILAKFGSPDLAAYPPEVKDPEGYFAANTENVLGLAYNTNLVAQPPKSYDDLLDPKWKGRISTQSNSQGVQLVGALQQLKGDAYLQKLAQQGVVVFNQPAAAIDDQIAAGQVDITVPNAISNVLLLQRKGAPIGWVPLDAALTTLVYVALPAKSSHPHVAALFADWLLSQEGEEAMVRVGQGATRPGVQNDYGDIPQDFKRFYLDTMVPPSELTASSKRWSDLQTSLFIKR